MGTTATAGRSGTGTASSPRCREREMIRRATPSTEDFALIRSAAVRLINSVLYLNRRVHRGEWWRSRCGCGASANLRNHPPPGLTAGQMYWSNELIEKMAW